MNSLAQNQFPLLDQMHDLRDGVLDSLSDADLDFKVEGNPTLREQLAALGAVERAYTDSFRTFRMNWGLLHALPDADMSSVAAVKSWFAALDAQLKAALTALSEDDVQHKTVDRSGFAPSILMQFHIYREALLIVYGKLSIYMGTLGKTPTQQWKDWIG